MIPPTFPPGGGGSGLPQEGVPGIPQVGGWVGASAGPPPSPGGGWSGRLTAPRRGEDAVDGGLPLVFTKWFLQKSLLRDPSSGGGA